MSYRLGFVPKTWPAAFGTALLFPIVALSSCSDDGSSAGLVDPDPSATGDASQDGSTPLLPTPTDAGGDAGPIPKPGPQDGPWTFTTLKDQMLSTNGVPVRVELIRADRPDGRHSYFHYQHSIDNAAMPLVIQHEPYSGIDWTGEEVDTRWAKMGNGGHPDTDAPSYNGTDQVAFVLQSPQAAVDANILWAFNHFASIRPYARFYAGGTLEDDVLDAAAPYFFARTRPAEIDTTRIGAVSASWGGMMSLFGASHTPLDVAPRAVAAVSPVSDFVDLWDYAKNRFPAVYPKTDDITGFYSPYWRRATVTLGNPPSGAGDEPYTHAGLCSALRGRILAAHDDWDTIIPVTQTQKLAAACSNVEPLYWPRGPLNYQTAKIDHGPAATEGVAPTILMFSYTFLVEELAPPTMTTVYSIISQPSLVTHLQLILTAQKAGKDVSYILPRLREVADPRLTVFVSETNAQAPGAKIVAAAINQVWKTTFDEAGIRTQLATGLPTPPP